MLKNRTAHLTRTRTRSNDWRIESFSPSGFLISSLISEHETQRVIPRLLWKRYSVERAMRSNVFMTFLQIHSIRSRMPDLPMTSDAGGSTRDKSCKHRFSCSNGTVGKKPKGTFSIAAKLFFGPSLDEVDLMLSGFLSQIEIIIHRGGYPAVGAARELFFAPFGVHDGSLESSSVGSPFRYPSEIRN